VNCSNNGLDTRRKILSLDDAETATKTSRPLRVIAGHFDPLTATHARGIQRKPDGRVLVIVTDPPDPILSLSARAELVAALDAVDYVVSAMDNTSAEIIARLQPDDVTQEEAADLRRTEDLVAHVKARQIAKET